MRKNYLIIGGTGSLGKAILPYLKKGSITIFSRDEQKQAVMAKKYPEFHYIIGDIRDEKAVMNACQNKDTIFHFAALKHVDILEANPLEAKNTNLDGSINVGKSCIENNVPFCVFCSTDKAVLPINAYGFSKGFASKILLHFNKIQNVTKFSVYTWGNVLASRGSVVPFFIKTLKEEKKVYITDPRMTRFWITLDKAATFIIDSYQREDRENKERIPPIKTASIERVANMIAVIMEIEDYKTEYIGIRPGEKIHECLYSSHEFCINSKTHAEYTDNELYNILEPIVRSFI